jgi:hypothetical protein
MASIAFDSNGPGIIIMGCRKRLDHVVFNRNARVARIAVDIGKTTACMIPHSVRFRIPMALVALVVDNAVIMRGIKRNGSAGN